jgi:hypothetical protein
MATSWSFSFLTFCIHSYKVMLYGTGWPRTCDLSASASQVSDL